MSDAPARQDTADDEQRYVPLRERGGWLQARARQPRRADLPLVLVDGVFGRAVSFQPGRVTLQLTDETERVVSRPDFDVVHAAALAEMAALDDDNAEGTTP